MVVCVPSVTSFQNNPWILRLLPFPRVTSHEHYDYIMHTSGNALSFSSYQYSDNFWSLQIKSKNVIAWIKQSVQCFTMTKLKFLCCIWHLPFKIVMYINRRMTTSKIYMKYLYTNFTMRYFLIDIVINAFSKNQYGLLIECYGKY